MDSTLSSVFWIDRKILEEPVIRLLKQAAGTDDARTRRIKEIKDENWDLFIRILADGSVVVTAVAVSLIYISGLILLKPCLRI